MTYEQIVAYGLSSMERCLLVQECIMEDRARRALEALPARGHALHPKIHGPAAVHAQAQALDMAERPAAYAAVQALWDRWPQMSQAERQGLSGQTLRDLCFLYMKRPLGGKALGKDKAELIGWITGWHGASAAEAAAVAARGAGAAPYSQEAVLAHRNSD